MTGKEPIYLHKDEGSYLTLNVETVTRYSNKKDKSLAGTANKITPRTLGLRSIRADWQTWDIIGDRYIWELGETGLYITEQVDDVPGKISAFVKQYRYPGELVNTKPNRPNKKDTFPAYRKGEPIYLVKGDEQVAEFNSAGRQCFNFDQFTSLNDFHDGYTSVYDKTCDDYVEKPVTIYHREPLLQAYQNGQQVDSRFYLLEPIIKTGCVPFYKLSLWSPWEINALDINLRGATGNNLPFGGLSVVLDEPPTVAQWLECPGFRYNRLHTAALTQESCTPEQVYSDSWEATELTIRKRLLVALSGQPDYLYHTIINSALRGIVEDLHPRKWRLDDIPESGEVLCRVINNVFNLGLHARESVLPGDITHRANQASFYGTRPLNRSKKVYRLKPFDRKDRKALEELGHKPSCRCSNCRSLKHSAYVNDYRGSYSQLVKRRVPDNVPGAQFIIKDRHFSASDFLKVPRSIMLHKQETFVSVPNKRSQANSEVYTTIIAVKVGKLTQGQLSTFLRAANREVAAWSVTPNYCVCAENDYTFLYLLDLPLARHPENKGKLSTLESFQQAIIDGLNEQFNRRSTFDNRVPIKLVDEYPVPTSITETSAAFLAGRCNVDRLSYEELLTRTHPQLCENVTRYVAYPIRSARFSFYDYNVLACQVKETRTRSDCSYLTSCPWDNKVGEPVIEDVTAKQIWASYDYALYGAKATMQVPSLAFDFNLVSLILNLQALCTGKDYNKEDYPKVKDTTLTLANLILKAAEQAKVKPYELKKTVLQQLQNLYRNCERKRLINDYYTSAEKEMRKARAALYFPRVTKGMYEQTMSDLYLFKKKYNIQVVQWHNLSSLGIPSRKTAFALAIWYNCKRKGMGLCDFEKEYYSLMFAHPQIDLWLKTKTKVDRDIKKLVQGYNEEQLRACFKFFTLDPDTKLAQFNTLSKKADKRNVELADLCLTAIGYNTVDFNRNKYGFRQSELHVAQLLKGLNGWNRRSLKQAAFKKPEALAALIYRRYYTLVDSKELAQEEELKKFITDAATKIHAAAQLNWDDQVKANPIKPEPMLKQAMKIRRQVIKGVEQVTKVAGYCMVITGYNPMLSEFNKMNRATFQLELTPQQHSIKRYAEAQLKRFGYTDKDLKNFRGRLFVPSYRGDPGKHSLLGKLKDAPLGIGEKPITHKQDWQATNQAELEELDRKAPKMECTPDERATFAAFWNVDPADVHTDNEDTENDEPHDSCRPSLFGYQYDPQAQFPPANGNPF